MLSANRDQPWRGSILDSIFFHCAYQQRHRYKRIFLTPSVSSSPVVTCPIPFYPPHLRRLARVIPIGSDLQAATARRRCGQAKKTNGRNSVVAAAHNMLGPVNPAVAEAAPNWNPCNRAFPAGMTSKVLVYNFTMKTQAPSTVRAALIYH